MFICSFHSTFFHIHLGGFVSAATFCLSGSDDENACADPNGKPS